MAAAIAAAAKKRAEKLGLQNQEVDETNVGGADPQLAHPFFGKLKQSTNDGGLSPRSKRLKELEEKDGKGKENEEPKPQPAQPPPPQPPAPAPAAAPPPPAPEKKIDVAMVFSENNASQLLSTASQGSKQQQLDGVSVVKRWSSIEATKLEMAESADVFQLLGDIAMGPHEEPREQSIDLLRSLCADDKVFPMLLGTGAAFAPLQQMMSSDQPMTQLAGVELFAALCESEMPGDGGGGDLGGGMMDAAAHAVPEAVPAVPATRDLGGAAPDPAVADPTMELEDPEEALAKVIAAAQGQGPASPEMTVEKPETVPLDPSAVKVDLGQTNGIVEDVPQPPAAPQPAPPQPPQPPAEEVAKPEPKPEPPAPKPQPQEEPEPQPPKVPEPKEEPKPQKPEETEEPKKQPDTRPPKPSGPQSPARPEPPKPGPSAPPPPPQDDGCQCCVVM